MFTNNNSNKIPLLLLILMLSFLFHYGIAESVDDVFPKNEVKLPKESAQLLDQIKKGVVEYNKKLKSGKIEFTVTLSQRLKDQEQKLKKAKFENVGTWYIVYNFEGARHFYDVRMRKKVEFNGTRLPNWTEKRYQFQIDSEKMLIREQQEIGWIQYPQPTGKSIFKSEFNPRRWGWNPGVFSFRFLIKYAPPIKVEKVEVDGVHLYLLTLYRVHNEMRSLTEQLWVDPQKGYRPKRRLRSTKDETQTGPVYFNGKPIRQPPEFTVSRIHNTFQIEQFNQGLWFPKTATSTLGYDPDTQQGFRKTTMQVQKATFNIPIDEKDLRFPD